MQTWQQEYGAGGDEYAGRVIEPRNGYSCGHYDKPFPKRRVKAEALQRA